MDGVWGRREKWELNGTFNLLNIQMLKCTLEVNYVHMLTRGKIAGVHLVILKVLVIAHKNEYPKQYHLPRQSLR